MLTGSLVALITPMHTNGEVDYASLKRLVEFHIEQGTDGIVAVGTTGESATLPAKEHIEVVSKIVEYANGRIKVIGGNGANSTLEAIELTKGCEKAGVDAMLGVTPYYNKPSEAGLIAHYKAVAAATHIPQILYNVPGRTALDMKPQTIAKLCDVANIIGVKEASGDVARVAELRQLCGEDFLLFSGDDATAKEFMLAGGNGVISVVNNVVPKLFKRMCDAALAGDRELATELDQPMRQLHDVLFIEANPIPVKWAVLQMGLIDNGHIRLPLTELNSDFHGQVKQAMKMAGVEA
ncbi:4-hydroxy-tetrahydrodipicolinate synthase [Paraferrimonas sp. SM1919]|uniref:4-hydroxy-tetrahydrodipicolinate synthase n=1 Tax=Paraferrimonas sp. SM1919 TaxID=2662263 RepID=UPI0013D3FBFB|nr:4-hydroxy-tetrahydrodipicolinate synthase [Paraferrimonas sp. SM1919]